VAIQSMEQDALGDKFVQALQAARQRAHELGDEFGN
jgi:pyrroline-5-carboxylate reductase